MKKNKFMSKKLKNMTMRDVCKGYGILTGVGILLAAIPTAIYMVILKYGD